MEKKTKENLKLAAIILVGTAATGVLLYYGHKKLAQKAFNDGLVSGAAIGRDAVINIIKRCDPESGLISGLRNIGIVVSKCKW